MAAAAPKPKAPPKTEGYWRRVLRQERTAHIALAEAYLREANDPDSLLARVDRMVRAAIANPRTPAPRRAALLAAQAFLTRACQIRAGEPQALFDPDAGHVNPNHVTAIVDAPDPLLLALPGLDDPDAAHREREATTRRVEAGIVAALAASAAGLTDEQIPAAYARLAAYPLVEPSTLRRTRADLTRRGRLVRADTTNPPRWLLMEHA